MALLLFSILVRDPLAQAPIYQFHQAADSFFRIMNPTQSLKSTPTLSYMWRDHFPSFGNLEALYLMYLKATRAAREEPAAIDLGDDNLDSYWHVSRFSQEKASIFLHHCLESDLPGVLQALNEGTWRFRSALEKALFQRDLYQAISLLYHACDKGCATDEAIFKDSLLEGMKPLFIRARLSKAEFQELQALLPSEADPRFFSQIYDGKAERPYLPRVVLGNDPLWFTIPYDAPPKHMVDMEGRSFFHGHVKIPGMQPHEVPDFWRSVFIEHGGNDNVSARVPLCPPMTETMLVRTMGVFLNDGSFADSGFPEAVNIRIFKTSRPTLDMSTGDFRGTIYQVLAMKRRALLNNPASLGLQVISLESPAYFGILQGAPDAKNAYTDALTTVRQACINCHSALFHGTPTIFSFVRPYPESQSDAAPGHNYGDILSFMKERGFSRLNTPVYQFLMGNGSTRSSLENHGNPTL